MPNGSDLAAILDEAFSLKTGSTDLSVVAQLAVIRRNGARADLTAQIQTALDGFEPDESIVALTRIPWRAIYTTNYDPGILRAYELSESPPKIPVVVSTASDVANVDPDFNVAVYYLHGRIFGDDPSKILITRDDYSRFRQSRVMLFERLRSALADSTFVYLGYGNRDSNWETLQSEMRAEFAGAEFPQAYRIAPTTDPLEREVLAATGTVTIDGTTDDFAAALETIASQLSRVDVSQVILDRSVPISLRGAVAETPAPVLRLLNSWEYCNDADFGESPNVHDFLRGDRPNWGVIERGTTFTRDVEDDIYNDLLDFVTSSGHLRYTGVVVGAAGYGTSTLLMQLAHRLVKDKAAPVFRLRAGAEVIEGDVLLACDLFPKDRPIFVIDDAAWQKTRTRTAVAALNQARKSAGFILGARLNEWRHVSQRLSATEYAIDPLSNAEIERLIQLLAKENELGQLLYLDHELRVAAIRNRNNKDLLVTLREVTEGRQFEAIIEDEYRKIEAGSRLAAQIYQNVCAVSQEGEFLRDEVAARILNISTSELFSELSHSLEGVVIDQTIDAANGVFGFRARHRSIAQIVWQRSLAFSEREQVLLGLMRQLNLTYRSDRDAFDLLVQSDELVDSMQSLDAKVRYFEAASANDPGNPYVKQHFARMYLRAGQLTSALGQIEQALQYDGSIRVLRHTKGTILSRLCNTTSATDVARRFLAQAEAEFNYGITVERRDEYSYQSLATLYREWAERNISADESTSYLRRAEEVIANGLRNCRIHDRLHIESAKIAADVGDDEGRMEALKRAVESEGHSAVANYLYGRALISRGEYEAAIAVLRPVIINDPNAYRAAIELAVAEATVSNDFRRGVAILLQATLFGDSDGRFVATLGGMQYLAGALDDAETTFRKGRSLPAEEQRAVVYRPQVRVASAPVTAVKLTGRVNKVGPGFSFVAVPNHSDVYLGTSIISGQRLHLGTKVRFAVVFRAVGPLADTGSVVLI